MSNRLRWLPILLCAALTACSSGITVTRVQGDSPVVGNPWNLGMTQFNVTITRNITKCGEHMEGGVEILATPGVVVDQQQRFVLSSNGWWATSDITSTMAASGISTGLNAQSADQTATIVSNMVATFGKVVVGAASGGVFALVRRKDVCSDKVQAAVKELFPATGKTLKEAVDQKTVELAAATTKVELFTALARADKSNNKELAAALKEQAKAKEALAEVQKKLTDNLKITSDTQIVSWPLDSSEFRRDQPLDLPEATFEKWTGLKRQTDEDKAAFSKAYAGEKGQFAVYLSLYRQDTNGAWVAPAAPSAANEKVGVPVRLARTGRLLVCAEKACPRSISIEGIKDSKIKASDQLVLQMGQVYTVPITGGSFRSQTGVIAMDANGLPTTIQVAEKAAAGVGLTGTAKDVATQLAALPADVRAAELARVKAQADQANAQIALKNAQANLALSDQTSDLAAQTALINAQTGFATAQINAGYPLQTAALTAQTNYINAQSALAASQVSSQTALLNAQIALANAQANAALIDRASVLAAQATLINAQTALLNAAAALAKAQVAAP